MSGPFRKGVVIKIHVVDCGGIFVGVGVWVKCEKRQKSVKSRDVQPRLRFCADFTVIVRRGCGWFGGEKLVICDR